MFRERFRETHVPKNYRASIHIGLNFLFLMGVMTACAIQFVRVGGGVVTFFLVFLLSLLLGNVGVYLIHRYPLHQRLPGASYAFKVHSLWHHVFYKIEAMELEEERDAFILFFPPSVVFIFSFIAIPLIIWVVSSLIGPAVAFSFAFGSAFYFFLYEVLHFISHLPADSKILRFWWFKIMWHHHRLHHDPKIMDQVNFNIVFPLCDYVFRTYRK